jgi:hypothetical protein
MAEHRVVIPDALIRGIREGADAIRRDPTKLHQFVRVHDRQGAQQQHVDEAEDRGVGANRQRHRERRDRGGGRRPAHRPQRVAKVSAQILDPVDPARVPDLFLDQRDVAELPQCRRSGLLRSEARCPMQLELTLEMIAQLIVQILLDTAAMEERTKAKADGSDRAHVEDPFVTDA